MSRKNKEDSKSLLDKYLENPNAKLIYNSLLKFGPLTIGEIHFITQLEKPDTVKTVKELIGSKLVELIKDPQEMYLAKPPFTFFSSKLEKLQNANTTSIQILKKEMDNLNTGLNKNFEKHDLANVLTTLNDDLENNQRQLIVDFKTTYDGSLSEILKKISLIATNTLQERENIHNKATKDIKDLVDNTVEKINVTLKESEKESSIFQDQLNTNKKSFKNIIQELTASVEDTAKNIATNIQESIKEVEESFVTALRNSISESVSLSQNFRDELTENNTSIKDKTLKMVSTIDENAITSLDLIIKNVLGSKLSDNVDYMEEQINPLITEFNTKLEQFKELFLNSNEEIKVTLDKEISTIIDDFLRDVSPSKEKLKLFKDTFPSQLGGMSNILQEKIGKFVLKITNDFDRNSSILETITLEYLEKINEFSETELNHNLSDNQELAEKIGLIIEKLGKNILKESKSWEKTSETIEKGLRDLSANINRRLDLFIKDAKTEFNDNSKEVTEDLNSFLQQSNKLKEDIDEYNSFFTSSLEEFKTKNELLKHSSIKLISENKDYIESQKSQQIEKISMEIKHFAEQPVEKFNIANKEFNSDVNEFTSDFKNQINDIIQKNKILVIDNEKQLLNELDLTKNEYQEKIKENQSHINNTFSKINDQMNKTIDEAVKNIIESFNQLKDEFLNDIQSEKEKVSLNYTDIFTSFDNILDRAAQISNETLTLTNNSFSEYFSSFSNKLDEKVDISRNKIDSIGLDLKNLSETAFNKTLDQINHFIDDIGKKSIESNDSLIKSLLDLLNTSSEEIGTIQENSQSNIVNISDLFQKLQAAIQKTFAIIDERTKRIDGELVELSSSNTEKLNEQLQETSALITSNMTDLVNSAENKFSDLEAITKESITELMNNTEIKTASQTEKLSEILNEYKDTKLDTLRKSVAQYKEKTSDFQSDTVAIAHEISSNIHETFENSYNTFSDLINRFEVQLKSGIKKTKENLNKLVSQNSESLISENIDPSIASTKEIINSLNNELENLKSTLSDNLDENLSALALEIKKIEGETSTNIKSSFNEGNEKLTKLFDSYQSKLINQESEEVQSLREVAEKLIEPLELIETVVSDRISGSIIPYQENMDQSLNEQKEAFNTNLKKITSSYSNLLSDSKSLSKNLSETLNQSLTSTDETIQDYHKVVSSELTIFEEKFRSKLEESVNHNIEQGIVFLNQSHELYQKDSQSLKSSLLEFLEHMANQLGNVTNEAESNIQLFSNLIRTVSDFLMQENPKGQLLIKEVKKFIAPDDLTNNILSIVEDSNKRLSIVVPSLSLITDDVLDKINKKSRTRIITNKSDSDNKSLEKIYKKKGNVSIFESKNAVPFILIIGEGSEADSKTNHAFKAVIGIISDDQEKGTPGFTITNKNMIDFFDKSVFVSILKNAKAKAREDVV